MPQVYDPAKHCGAAARRTGLPCTQPAGHRTDHQGYGKCWLHYGRTVNVTKAAVREKRFHEELDAIAGLALSQIADRLARLAAAGALAVNDGDHDDFSKAVNAFAKAAERAEGTKLTLDGRLAILRELPDGEVDAALSEIERLLARNPA